MVGDGADDDGHRLVCTVGITALRGVKEHIIEDGIAIGVGAMNDLRTGYRNVFIGTNAGCMVESGNNNICLGTNSTIISGEDNQIAIGTKIHASISIGPFEDLVGTIEDLYSCIEKLNKKIEELSEAFLMRPEGAMAEGFKTEFDSFIPAPSPPI